MHEHIQTSREGPLAIVRLNRPEALNALTDPMKEEMGLLFAELGRDPSVRALLFCAAGKAFCASGDVTSMGNFTPTTAYDRIKRAQRVVIAIANIEKPVVAAVQGAVAGIGWSMAMACDQIIAAESAFFSQVFKGVGLAPDGGAVHFLIQNLGVLRAKELVLSGRRIKAAEALELGLVSRVVPDADLERESHALAVELANGPTMAFGAGKRLFKNAVTPSLEAYLDSEATAQINLMLSDDHREGARAFFDKRKPVFKGT